MSLTSDCETLQGRIEELEADVAQLYRQNKDLLNLVKKSFDLLTEKLDQKDNNFDKLEIG